MYLKIKMEVIKMSEEYWDQDSNEKIEEVDISDSSLNTFIRANGSDIDIQPGVNFAEAIKDVALNAEFGKFRVFINNEEVKPSTAPDLFELGMKAEIRPYDKAAG